ncbi:hypothetical protein BGZ61DRAFT_487802 [Ilyonectria robusta]|uniref:uncharacterized protein n=1 Tax=Ilyonectria robusta TaxID=1079257 RepID=UPI001E8DBE69|nr:uncharacterized protein BGZ61DRAFT_487802 [Ilyonectria robusta]KAH8650677.1 hypothetical protein BGZ61DRAFT_487802 [Ilyonectria robusta]
MLIAGDAIYSYTVYLWLADLLLPALMKIWLSTLDLIDQLGPKTIIPGHSLTLDVFGLSDDLEYSRRYIKFFQDEIEAKGKDFFTPQEISDKFNAEFPGLVTPNSATSATLINVTGEEFGRGGTRLARSIDLTSYDDVEQLAGWDLD